MKRDYIYILLTNVLEMCIKYTLILNLAFEGQGLCQSQFSVFHVDIRVDVTWQSLSFTGPFSLMHRLPVWAGFQTIINSRIVIYFSLRLYKCYFTNLLMVLYARGYTLKGHNLPWRSLTLWINQTQNAQPRACLFMNQEAECTPQGTFSSTCMKSNFQFPPFNFCPTQ